MERKVFINGKELTSENYSSLLGYGTKLESAVDNYLDLFYDGTTDDERTSGISYSSIGNEIFVIEK